MKQFLALLGLLLVACGTAPQSHGGPVRDQVTLIDTLRGKGLTVDLTGNVSQPFLHPQSGTVLRISGGPLGASADLQVFEYSSAETASADAKGIRSDGAGTATTMISWVAPPHMFLKGRVLLIFAGTDPAVLSLLSSVLGPQFAGRS
jgi:hypothetical protein